VPEQEGLSEVLHSLDLLRRDMARVENRLGELVSLERYTTEHAVQERDHAKLEARVAKLEEARATMINMILSSFVFPLVIAIVAYFLSTGS
jgi:phage FluMu protein gp41